MENVDSYIGFLDSYILSRTATAIVFCGLTYVQFSLHNTGLKDKTTVNDDMCFSLYVQVLTNSTKDRIK